MRTRWNRLATAGGLLLLPFTLPQACTITVDGGPTVAVDLENFPHLDGDGEDSLLDRVFGFDDDDDDDDHDHGHGHGHDRDHDDD